jgi:hypothetical protein
MHLSAIDRFLWATGFAEQIILLGVLFFRGRARAFPMFTALIAFSLFETFFGSIFYSFGSHRAYYYAYWSMGVIDMLLQAGLVYEIARHVFAPLNRWAPDVRKAFTTMVWASVLIAIAFATLASPVKVNVTQRIIARGTLFSSTLMTELFVGLVVLSATAGLPWRTHVARIAQGAGIYAFASVLYDVCGIWLKWGQDAHTIRSLSQGLIGVSLTTFAYWIISLWQEAPEPGKMPESMRVRFIQLNRQLEYDLGRIRGWRKV